MYLGDRFNRRCVMRFIMALGKVFPTGRERSRRPQGQAAPAFSRVFRRRQSSCVTQHPKHSEGSMSDLPHHPLETIVDAIADRVATKVLDALSPRPPARILMADVTAHGAPSVRWVRDQARRGRIEIRGPRGAQYVDGAVLTELLAATTIRRRVTDAPDGSGNLKADAAHAISEIAAERCRGGRRA
jgi:hypothetical protein